MNILQPSQLYLADFSDVLLDKSDILQGHQNSSHFPNKSNMQTNPKMNNRYSLQRKEFNMSIRLTSYLTVCRLYRKNNLEYKKELKQIKDDYSSQQYYLFINIPHLPTKGSYFSGDKFSNIFSSYFHCIQQPKTNNLKKPNNPRMTKQSNQSILVPAKFISLILHLLVVTMAYFSFHDNILTAYPNITVKTDPLYIGGRVSFLACNTISLIFLFVEIVILFVGTNMFRERMNFISSSLHFLGAILWSSYIFQQWQFSQIWAIWVICSFLPFCMEIVTVFSVVNK